MFLLEKSNDKLSGNKYFDSNIDHVDQSSVEVGKFREGKKLWYLDCVLGEIHHNISQLNWL